MSQQLQHPTDPPSALGGGTGNLKQLSSQEELAHLHLPASPSSNTRPSAHSSAPPRLEPSPVTETSFVDIPDEVLGLVYSLLDPASRRALMHTCWAIHASRACLHQMTHVKVLLDDPASHPHDQLVSLPEGANVSRMAVCVPAGGQAEQGTRGLLGLWSRLCRKPWHRDRLPHQITTVEVQAAAHLSMPAAKNLRHFLCSLPHLRELCCCVTCLDELALPCLLEGFACGGATEEVLSYGMDRPVSTGCGFGDAGPHLPGLASLSLTINAAPHPLSEDDLHAIARMRSLSSLTLDLSCDKPLDLSALSPLTSLTHFHHAGREGRFQSTPEGYGTLHRYTNVPTFLAACPNLAHFRLDQLPLSDRPELSHPLHTLTLNVCGLHELGLLAHSFPRLHRVHVNFPYLSVEHDSHTLVSSLQHFHGGTESRSFSCCELGLEGDEDATPADPLFTLLPLIAPFLPVFDRLYVYKLTLGAEQLDQLLLLLRPRVISSLHIFCCAIEPPGLLRTVTAVSSLSLVRVTSGKFGELELPDVVDVIHAATAAEKCRFEFTLYPTWAVQIAAVCNFISRISDAVPELINSRISFRAECP